MKPADTRLAATMPVARRWLAATRPTLVAAAYVAGWKVVGALPERVAAALFATGADLAARGSGRGRTQLRSNLARVVARSGIGVALDPLVRAALRSYARYWLETFRLSRMDLVDVLARTRTEGAEHIDRARAAGRGVVLALPHSGNWEVAGVWLLDRGVAFATVAERLEPEALFDRFVAYREGLGMEILPLHGGSRPVMAALGERLRAGGCVCLVADRDLSGSGIAVEFFGEAARMPPGPALLAATTGAALLPVSVHYTEHGWAQWIGPPIELGGGRLRERVARGTQQLADHFAERIAAHPSDWHMLQPVWSADVEPGRP